MGTAKNLATVLAVAIVLTAPPLGCGRQDRAGDASPGDSAPAGAAAAEPLPSGEPDPALSAALTEIALGVGGAFGAAVVHVESGRRASVAGDRRFPMASVYKLPIALVALERVDDGALALADSVLVTPSDFAPFHSPLAAGARGRPVTVPLDSILRLAVAESDNTASDVLLRLVGGPGVVAERMRALGFGGIDVSRSEKELGQDDVARPDHLDDPRDTATPEAMAELLLHLERGAGLRPETHRLLLELLTQTRTGPRRLVAGVPPGAVVAHKTGTMRDVTNDVGLVTLPGGGGHLAIAVFATGPVGGERAREDAIAAVARNAVQRFAAP